MGLLQSFLLVIAIKPLDNKTSTIDSPSSIIFDVFVFKIYIVNHSTNVYIHLRNLQNEQYYPDSRVVF